MPDPPEHVSAGARFRALLDFAPDAMVVVGRDGRIIEANGHVEQLLGYDPGELKGESLEMLLPERFRARHVEHRAAYALAPQPRAMGKNLVLFARRRDGSEVPVEISLSPVDDPSGPLTIAALRDTSERWRMQEALRLNEERTRLLIESVREYAIFMLDPEGRVRTWNVGAERILGYGASEIVGRHFSAFYPTDDAAPDRPTRELAAAVRDGQYREEGWRVRADGSRFQADVTLTPLFDPDGSLRGFAKVTRDVTERKRAEEERERSIRARDELLSLLSHDLQNSINALSLNNHLLLRIAPTTEGEVRMHRYGAIIGRTADTMTRLIRDLLDLPHIERGEFRVEPRPEPVAPLVNDALDQMRALAREKSVQLLARVHGDTGVVFCDRPRIIQVLLNLVGNAVKFLPEGGEVVVEAGRAVAAVQFKVADNGPGIPPEDLPHVFERHWQSMSNTLHRGSGLGLYIVKTIVEAHQGRVWVQSPPGTGASFYFTLPPNGDGRAEVARDPRSQRDD